MPKTTKQRSQAYRDKIKADPIKYEKLKRDRKIFEEERKRCGKVDHRANKVEATQQAERMENILTKQKREYKENSNLTDLPHHHHPSTVS